MVLGIAVFAAVVLVGFKVVPVYFSNYEFEDALKNDALQATYSTHSEEEIRTAIIKRARDFDIDLTAKQVHVARTGLNGTGSISVDVEYSVPINLPGYSTVLEFHPSTQNKGVY